MNEACELHVLRGFPGTPRNNEERLDTPTPISCEPEETHQSRLTHIHIERAHSGHSLPARARR
jgi:hypothetical protein